MVSKAFCAVPTKAGGRRANRPLWQLGTVRVMVLAVAGGYWCSAAQADEIKLGGFWIGDVSIQGVEDGQVLYFNRVGTEFARPLASVQGLKLSAYPQLGQAYEAIEKGDDTAAQRALEQVRGKATAPWLRQWVCRILVQVYNRLNRPHEAVDLFLLLTNEGVPGLYLSHPPVQCLAQANPDVQNTLRQRINVALENLTGRPEAARMVTKLLESSKPNSGGDPQATTDGSGNPDVSTGSGIGEQVHQASQTQPARPILTLSRALDIGDTVTVLLLHGQFTQALARVDQILEKDGHRLPMRLYQRGIAQLYLAQASGDDKRYYDAGLSFMSVLAYFPHSHYAGPSLVEAGIVHSKIGRPDTAKKLYERAAIVIDAQEDPHYAARLEQLVEGFND